MPAALPGARDSASCPSSTKAIRTALHRFDRYVRDDEAGRTEVLVDPQTALPAEIHSSNAAGDQTFIEARYERDPGRGHVRRLLRSEQRFVDVPGTTVTEVEVTRLVVGDPVQR